MPLQPTHMGLGAVQPYCYRMPFHFHTNICGVKGMIHSEKAFPD